MRKILGVVVGVNDGEKIQFDSIDERQKIAIQLFMDSDNKIRDSIMEKLFMDSGIKIRDSTMEKLSLL
ncbi:hypothetical protein ACJIZ3_011208 [Penstemon smallii]|uniref:Uncharacterized protein n=1 Tax=Penstemon smallii TaxID=265156 RepID=A0ABD3R252_9LAMI